MYGNNKFEATRPIYWNVEHIANQVLLYALLLVCLVVLAWGLYSRLALWLSGRPDNNRFSHYLLRVRSMFRDVLAQVQTNRDPDARNFHSLIFWGFAALLFATTMVFLHQDLGWRVYEGRYYLAVTMVADVFGLLLMLGIALAYHRRYIRRPDRLHTRASDDTMLGLLFLLCLQGFLLEAARIYVTNDPWAAYSPVGAAFAVIFTGMSPAMVKTFHMFLWWFHAVTVFLFLGLIPYSKFFHIVSSSANLFFKNFSRPKGALSHPGDIEALLEASMEDEEEAEFRIGASTFEDLTWKQRLDLDACTSCGRCQDVCPAYNSGKVLSPKWLILDSREHMHKLHLKSGQEPERSWAARTLNSVDRSLLGWFLNESSNEEDKRRADNPMVQNEARKNIGESVDDEIAGTVLDEDVFWACTTCRACMEVCPVGIEHVDYIVDVRRSMALMQGNLPSEAQPALRAIETRGNPFGPSEDRMNWADGLELPILKKGDEVDVLYWVGCVSAFDKRKQNIARAMVKILNAAGVNWGMLGERECCTGDPARRLGEENLFQTQAKTNIATLSEVKFNRMVANCPHCFNTFKNEYPQVGDFSAGNDIEVVHHTHFIGDLVRQGKLTLSSALNSEITFHDPCYLGRYNDTYDEPRDVLVQLGASRLHEMESTREKAMCCGAGGGHFWFDMKVGERVNSLRVDQAAETGANRIATGCPFCMQMLEDGIKLTDRESELDVRDIAELVAEAI